MKKNKLSLDNFKVQSFVTSLNEGTENTLKGGTGESAGLPCEESVVVCDTEEGQCNSGLGPNCGLSAHPNFCTVANGAGC